MAPKSLVIASVIVTSLLSGPAVAEVTIETVDVAHDGGAPDGHSIDPAISPDGRFVAFSSAADNLVPGSSGGIFVRDTRKNTTVLASVSQAGTAADDALDAAISRRGRFVAFTSSTNRLVAGDTNDRSDVFLKNLTTGDLELVTRGPDGAPAGGASPTISADGRWIAVISNGMTATDRTPDSGEVYLIDRETRTVELVMVTNGGRQTKGHPFDTGVSDDGRFVSYASSAGLFVHDLELGRRYRADVNSRRRPLDGVVFEHTISRNGRRVAFRVLATNGPQADGNDRWDVYVHDLRTRRTVVASVLPRGRTPRGDFDAAEPSLSRTGRFVAFWSHADLTRQKHDRDLGDVYVRDLRRERTDLMSRPCRASGAPSLSGNGMAVAFESAACKGVVAGSIFRAVRKS